MKAQQIALASVEQSLRSAELPQLVWYDALLELERAGKQGLRPFELERQMLLAQYNLSRLIDRIEKVFGAKPERLAADTAYGTGKMLAWLLDKGITRMGEVPTN